MLKDSGNHISCWEKKTKQINRRVSEDPAVIILCKFCSKLLWRINLICCESIAVEMKGRNLSKSRKFGESFYSLWLGIMCGSGWSLLDINSRMDLDFLIIRNNCIWIGLPWNHKLIQAWPYPCVFVRMCLSLFWCCTVFVFVSVWNHIFELQESDPSLS